MFITIIIYTLYVYYNIITIFSNSNKGAPALCNRQCYVLAMAAALQRLK